MAEPKGRRKRASKRAGEMDQRMELTAEREVSLSPQADALPMRVAPDNGAESEEQVRRRAYELYVSRGGGHGRELDDWIRAEREVRQGIRGGPART